MSLDKPIRTSIISIITDIILLGIKGTTTFLTGSLAIMADVYHTVANLIVSITVLTTILLHHLQKRKPCVPVADFTSPDAESGRAGTHPALAILRAMPGCWIESLAAFFVLLLLLYTAYKIVSKVVVGPPDEIRNMALGLFSVTACIGIAYLVSRLKIMAGRETGSPALVADGYRSLMDMVTSITVFIAIMGQWIWIEIESVVTVVIALVIILTGLNHFISSLINLTRKLRSGVRE